MELALVNIYTRYYISQILNSTSYQEIKSNCDILDQYLDQIDEEMENKSTYIPKTNKPDYNDKKYKRIASYNRIFFSKLQVMGLVINSIATGDEKKARIIFYIDDGTGVIQGLVWKNYNSAIYEKAKDLIVK